MVTIRTGGGCPLKVITFPGSLGGDDDGKELTMVN
jgi:hypothetical protein